SEFSACIAAPVAERCSGWRGRLARESKGRKMKRLILGLVLAGLIALAVPSSAPAATYDLFAGCDATSTSPQRSHDCLTTDHMAAYFEASEDTKYEVCLYQNVTELLDCTSEEEAEADTLYQNELTIVTPGHYEVVWFDTTIE